MEGHQYPSLLLIGLGMSDGMGFPGLRRHTLPNHNYQDLNIGQSMANFSKFPPFFHFFKKKKSFIFLTATKFLMNTERQDRTGEKMFATHI